MLVIPVFIPHQGCPQNCLFCNQTSISGQGGGSLADTEFVQKTIVEWLGKCCKHDVVQVAFYGGSFTCLEHARQQNLLAAVQPFIQTGDVHSIRLSTRPDCIDHSVCDFLLHNGVKSVELGVQSLDDKVLQTAWRGHTAADSIRATELLKKSGLELGVQLMPGLPGETTLSWLHTVKEVVRLQPDCVRIYPTLVIGGSGLAKQYAAGGYSPITMNRALALCRRAKELFDGAGIKILRMGLQASESLEKQLVAGPYHPAFGEMVTARRWFKRTRKIVAESPANSHLIIQISDRDVSSFVGPKRTNIRRLEEIMEQDPTNNKSFKLTTDATFARGTLKYVVA